jgi:hypothetical protein
MLVFCKNCDKEFDKEPHRIKRCKNNFCSRSCSASYNNKIYKKRSPEGSCKQCSRPTTTSRVFCSTSCRKKHEQDAVDSIENKVCPKCKQIKPADEFYIQKRKLAVRYSCYCKGCHNKQNYNRKLNLKKQCLLYKGGKCEKCGYCKNLSALEFHHLDPTKKDFAIAELQSTSFEKHREKIVSELDKCILVCANCHRELHHPYLDFFLMDYCEEPSYD